VVETEDWVMALLEAQVKLALALVTLAHHRCLGFLGLEVGIGARRSEGVVRQASGDEEESGQEDRRQGDGVDDPVADARNDLEERAFPGGAGSHSSGQISYGILRVGL